MKKVRIELYQIPDERFESIRTLINGVLEGALYYDEGVGVGWGYEEDTSEPGDSGESSRDQ